MAKKQTEDIDVTSAAVVEEVVEAEYDEKYMQERITYTFPIDFSNTTDRTLVIIVNGKSFKIQRGVPVSVPRYVVETFNDSMRQKASTLNLQDKWGKTVNLTGE